jgi:hypothetical protein
LVSAGHPENHGTVIPILYRYHDLLRQTTKRLGGEKKIENIKIK